MPPKIGRHYLYGYVLDVDSNYSHKKPNSSRQMELIIMYLAALCLTK